MWQKKSEFADLRTGMHVTTLHDPETGAEHKLQIQIGADCCPHCGHATPKTNLGELNIAEHVSNEIAARNQSHADMRAFAQKHRVQVRPAK